jgi:acyl-[acyl-carrier-protein]-phospholipid O-acyltransferase/long-chain-fatty-acid--[acyl-carrier-protein] ligase
MTIPGITAPAQRSPTRRVVFASNRDLRSAALGFAYLLSLFAFLLLTSTLYGTEVLHLGSLPAGALLASLAIGMVIGCVAAVLLSGKKTETGLIPLGGLGMMIAAALLSRSGLSFPGVAWLLGVLGFFGGFALVPLGALMRHLPEPDARGMVIGATALLSLAGMGLAAGVYHLLAVVAHLPPALLFLGGAALILAGTIYAVYQMPAYLLRSLLWLATRSLYRIRIKGRENIPAKGGALFVCNHLSLVDALLVQASTDRAIRFVMLKDFFELPLIKPFARITRAIPISSRQRPREMIQALREASEALRGGEVVCIFAEGQITRIGQLLPFRRGFERIMKDVNAPIIPLCLDGVWGSMLSYQSGRLLWRFPRSIPHPVTVCYGRPLPATATHHEVRHAVQMLTVEAWRYRKVRMPTLPRAFIRTARQRPFRFAMGDARVPRLRWGAALVRTVFLARRLRPLWQERKMVGILLPPSVAGALVNYAAFLMGKVPVNLNYTAPMETLESCLQQCAIDTVLTSRVFLDKLKADVPGRLVYLEDIAKDPRHGEKLLALAMAWLLPARWLERALGCKKTVRLDDLATVLFSSGSTGDPKGVMLTHYNIGSNIEQMEQIVAINRRDRILGILPFFHSFGFTATLCLPARLAVGVVYHPTPLDTEAIGTLVRQYGINLLLATPTFLHLYLRGCDPEDFGSLQLVMAGAEKMPERLAFAFEEKFGIRPLEGYGCTECAPAVAVNTHDFRSTGMRQVGAKRGTIGHPLPGISIRIVDPVTMQPLPVNQAGLMLVKGPNIMKGYLGRPDKTAEAFHEGWYVTGDVAAEDDDGFLQITDRLSRFSKIGGEMVPHVRVEEKLHELAGVTEPTFVVTGVPDEKKGEHLLVLHTLEGERLDAVFHRLPRLDLPNLWIPRPNQFFPVKEFPFLGTGKLDLRRVRELARELTAAAATTETNA